MLVVSQYFTDVGVVVPYLSMEIAYLDNNLRPLQRIKTLNPLPIDIIPGSLLGLLQQFNRLCLAEVLPRYAVLTLEDGQKIKVSYPFRPGSTGWQIFWNDLLANPLIISAQGIGESISDPFLKRVN
ncbi:hypothetical protein QUB29_19485 [Microcoleus sp. B4b_D2]|uniref:hypothetical protein n=1 Tax=Microcoleus sp. B4b_D2 TaxID=3055310 RepID=UPI002FD2EAC2